MEQAKEKYSGTVLPFPDAAIRRRYRAGRGSTRQTLIEATRGELAMAAHFADFMYGRAMRMEAEARMLADAAQNIWAGMDEAYHRLAGVGIDEAPGCTPRLHIPSVTEGAQ